MALTVTQLVSHIKERLVQLNQLVDIIYDEYKVSCDIIDPNSDRRKAHLDQLQELNETLSNIIDQHPSMCVDKIYQNTTSAIFALAKDGNNL